MDRAYRDRIGASEARTHFSSLLNRVAQGATVTITRHGTAIARLVPVEPARDRLGATVAIARIKALSKRNRLRGLDLKTLIEDGRP